MTSSDPSASLQLCHPLLLLLLLSHFSFGRYWFISGATLQLLLDVGGASELRVPPPSGVRSPSH